MSDPAPMHPREPGWGLAGLLTLGLLGWELALLAVLPSGRGLSLEALGAALARDAGLLLPVTLLALGWTRWRMRRGGSWDASRTAPLLTVSLLTLLVTVAVGRALLPRPAEGPAASDERRFLCATVRPVAPGANPRVEAARQGARDALVLQAPVLPLALLLLRRRSAVPGQRPRPLGARLAPWAVWGLACAQASDDGRLVGHGPSWSVAGGCPEGAPVRAYAVVATAQDIALNAQGDHLPGGLLYTLEDAPRRPPASAPEPLVLRANLGECLALRFTNRLAREDAALRIEGLRATVLGADGFVPGAALPPGGHLTYVLALPEAPEAEGAYLLHDASEDGARERRGLFGALVLEPAGAEYRDAVTGEPLSHGSGGEALIAPATGPGFRERVLIHHALGTPDEADVRSAEGTPLPVLDEMAGPFRAGAFGLSYRSEPQFERDEPPARAAPLFRSTLGESIRLRLVQAGSAELHIPHVHGWNERRGQWAPRGAETAFERPWLLTPGRSLTLATSERETFPAAPGDYLLHCHMPNHSAGGERLTWHVSAALPAP